MDRAKTVLDLAYTESLSVANSVVGDSREEMSMGTLESSREGYEQRKWVANEQDVGTFTMVEADPISSQAVRHAPFRSLIAPFETVARRRTVQMGTCRYVLNITF